MAMPSHGEMVARVKALDERIGALEGYAQGPHPIPAPPRPEHIEDDEGLFTQCCLALAVGSLIGNPAGAHLEPSHLPESNAIKILAMVKRARVLWRTGAVGREIERLDGMAEREARQRDAGRESVAAPSPVPAPVPVS